MDPAENDALAEAAPPSPEGPDLHNACTRTDASGGDGGSALEKMAVGILSNLKRHGPVVVPGLDPELHYLAPHVSKAAWTALGDSVCSIEKSNTANVDGASWISLRLDGSGFSKAIRVMRRTGMLEKTGFSNLFSDIMQECLRLLMDKFNCLVGFTQSDEMTVVMAPTKIIRGERQVHIYHGRVAKLTTLAAGFVTSHFVMRLARVCMEKNISMDDLIHIAPHFDCRLGHYSCWEEAQAILMWRASDCAVNGVSDAVYHTPGSGKAMSAKNTKEKLIWLFEKGLLPLPPRQAYGTILVRSRRIVEGFNPKTNENVQTLRRTIELVEGNFLDRLRKEKLFPPEPLIVVN